MTQLGTRIDRWAVMGLSVEHAALVLLFENQPSLALELLRRTGRIGPEVGGPAELASADLTQAVPAEYRADLVIRHRGGSKPLAIVLEVQRDVDPDKRFSWPVYATLLRARFRSEVRLVVFATNPTVARWARQPIEIGNSAVFVPTVCSLDDVPAVTDHALARAEPELAVLSAMAHGSAPDTERAAAVATATLAALAGLPTDRAMLYFDLVRAALSEAARKVIDAMIPEGYKFKSDFALKYIAEGKAEGLAEGKAEGLAEGEAMGEASALLAVLEARGISLSPEQREQIVSCRDLALLDRWVRRAVTVADARELFA